MLCFRLFQFDFLNFGENIYFLHLSPGLWALIALFSFSLVDSETNRDSYLCRVISLESVYTMSGIDSVRARKREELLQWLTMTPIATAADHGDGNNMSLYSIVGHGRVGKTTLAELVFYIRIAEESFFIKKWVCESGGFDVKWIIETMLESATGQRPRLNSLTELQDALKESLWSFKKFLLKSLTFG